MPFEIGDNLHDVLFVVTSAKPIAPGNLCVGILHRNDQGDLSYKSTLPEDVVPGTLVTVDGYINVYNGQAQFNGSILAYEGDELDPIVQRAIIPCSRLSTTIMYEEMVKPFFYDETGDPICAIAADLADKFHREYRSYPGAKSNHHAYIGGLMEHTYGIYRMAQHACYVYPYLDRNLMLAGAFLHDIGKIQEYDLANSGLVSNYSVAGNLLGHTVIGINLITEAAKKHGVENDPRIMALLNMIAAHHGNREWGAVAEAATPEAIVLHMLDNLDAKLEIYRNNLAGLEVGEVTDYIPTVAARLFKAHTGIDDN